MELTLEAFKQLSPDIGGGGKAPQSSVIITGVRLGKMFFLAKSLLWTTCEKLGFSSPFLRFQPNHARTNISPKTP
jgi:hypothetical protein